MRGPHLKPNGTRASATTRTFPLNEPGMPEGAPLREIIAWLDVETNARYARTPASTFCNIYAYDVCYLAGVYLPHVWWMDPTSVNDNTPVAYMKTVSELNANALYDWLVEWGVAFGWTKLASAEEAQMQADNGRVVVICAAQKVRSRSGHIVVVAPQIDGEQALQVPKFVPLQSQAGAKNYCASCQMGRWWESSNFRGFGIWSNKA